MSPPLEALSAFSPFALTPAVGSTLETAYATAGRHYHTLEHVLEVAGHYAEARFALYQQQVKDEYCAVIDPDVYAAGRNQFLAGLLARERIFLSDFFHQRLEARARHNLRVAIG